MYLRIPIVVLASAAAVLSASTLRPTSALPSTFTSNTCTGPTLSAGWVCDKADNLCGLDDARMLSSPAKVDYDALYKATPEYRKLRDDKIDPNSSEGIQLKQKAADRIRDAAERARVSKGYCSVWKSVRHSDGRSVPDVTEAVKALL